MRIGFSFPAFVAALMGTRATQNRERLYVAPDKSKSRVGGQSRPRGWKDKRKRLRKIARLARRVNRQRAA
jgi:hypothetical protein